MPHLSIVIQYVQKLIPRLWLHTVVLPSSLAGVLFLGWMLSGHAQADRDVSLLWGLWFSLLILSQIFWGLFRVLRPVKRHSVSATHIWTDDDRAVRRETHE